MGCICAKGINPDVDGEPHGQTPLNRIAAVLKKAGVSAETAGAPQEGTAGDINKGRREIGEGPRVAGSLSATGSETIRVPDGFSGEHDVEGWPDWLTAVAGETIKGWKPRRAGSFEKLDKIGQGTYSIVYRARDLETGKVVALKKVRFVNVDPESVHFMAREIHVLCRLDHPNVIKLEGIIASRNSCSLFLIFEYMEHDLAGLAARPGIKFSEEQVKCYMQQLLEGLAHCHSRGVLHRDIKGSNLLIGGNGILKIADFGLATSFSPDQKQPLTSRVVTLWYRPPELLFGATEYGVAVDLWSSGCILAELLAGKPIMPGRTEVEQLHKIFKLCGSPSEDYWKKSKFLHSTLFKPQHQYKRCVVETFKDFPSSSLGLLDSLLSIEPTGRGTAASALDNEFFKTQPLACDPSSLPKYPPSKEYDAKLRDEEIVRKRAEAQSRQGIRRTMEMPNENVMMQKQQAQTSSKSNNDKYNAEDESRELVDLPQRTTQSSSLHPGGFGSSCSKKVNEEDPHIPGYSYGSLQMPNDPWLQRQRSYMQFPGTADSSGSMLARSTTNSRYNHFNVYESSGKHRFDRPAYSRKRQDRIVTKGPTIGYSERNKIIQYSGPLMPPGRNVDDILKEHERQIQQAVRNACLDKVKTMKKFQG